MGIAFCFILGSKLKLTYTPVVIDPDWIANVRLCHKERDFFFWICNIDQFNVGIVFLQAVWWPMM